MFLYTPPRWNQGAHNMSQHLEGGCPPLLFLMILFPPSQGQRYSLLLPHLVLILKLTLRVQLSPMTPRHQVPQQWNLSRWQTWRIILIYITTFTNTSMTIDDFRNHSFSLLCTGIGKGIETSISSSCSKFH